jgi:chaperone modulatory protein CbpM
MTVKTVSGKLLDERANLSLDEICNACSVRTEWVIDLVAEGILEPSGGERTQWTFSASSISRVRVARRLQTDLDINLAGVALAIDLLEEIEAMRAPL